MCWASERDMLRPELHDARASAKVLPYLNRTHTIFVQTFVRALLDATKRVRIQRNGQKITAAILESVLGKCIQFIRSITLLC